MIALILFSLLLTPLITFTLTSLSLSMFVDMRDLNKERVARSCELIPVLTGGLLAIFLASPFFFVLGLIGAVSGSLTHTFWCGIYEHDRSKLIIYARTRLAQSFWHWIKHLPERLWRVVGHVQIGMHSSWLTPELMRTINECIAYTNQQTTVAGRHNAISIEKIACEELERIAQMRNNGYKQLRGDPVHVGLMAYSFNISTEHELTQLTERLQRNLQTAKGENQGHHILPDLASEPDEPSTSAPDFDEQDLGARERAHQAALTAARQKS